MHMPQVRGTGGLQEREGCAVEACTCFFWQKPLRVALVSDSGLLLAQPEPWEDCSKNIIPQCGVRVLCLSGGVCVLS